MWRYFDSIQHSETHSQDLFSRFWYSHLWQNQPVLSKCTTLI